jgi:subtilisin family serine protease
MNRCLHITIHETAVSATRRATRSYLGRSGDDPAADNVLPVIEDPDYGTDDPAADNVLSPIEDPDGGTGFAANSANLDYGATVTGHSCGCGCCAPAGVSPATASTTATLHPFIAPREFSGFVIVRTAQGIDPNAANLWELATSQKLAGLKAVLELAVEKQGNAENAEKDEKAEKTRRVAPVQPPTGALLSRPLIELQGRVQKENWGLLPRGECLAKIRALEKCAALTAFPPLHSLTAYWRLDLRERPDLVEDVVARLNRLAEVDLAYRELTASDPHTLLEGKVFAEDQGYLGDAPLGIGASWAWKSLTNTPPPADQIMLCDLEQGWDHLHQDLKEIKELSKDVIYGVNRAVDEGTPGHHGTAVLGQLAATGHVMGAATGLGEFVLASHYRSKKESHPFAGTNGHVAAAITQTLAALPSSGPLGKGSILLLEVQRGRLPAEVDEADFDAIRLASGSGVVVVEAAGNGGFDLDAYSDPETGRSLRRRGAGFRDSGAILVGASRASLPHDRAPFSNYGSRLDCFAWGETVTTCGYGDLAGTGAADFYTNSFSGTSSASPIIAGAAALVQALHKDKAGFWLDPSAMRALLSDPATGTRQGPNVPGFIGIMPDLRAVVRGKLQLVPDVYMRRHIGDDGSVLGPDEEISSSPDILIWEGPGIPAQRFGEEGPRTNTPAPGNQIDPADPDALYSGGNHLYIRLRNRGGDAGEARVQLFASPATTLITPERWMPVDTVTVQQIVQGDTLTVSTPIPIDLPQKWAQEPSKWPTVPPSKVVPAYSFLAVQLPWDEPKYSTEGFQITNTLPPGPPYFNWEEYRSFLRGPGVTWRNVHPIKVKPNTDMTLAFLLAGTPDQTRRFDFEVIQRLPAGVTVTLQIPPAIAAKFRQRQPWLANGSADLTLPSRPRTTFSKVALAPGACAHASFHVTVGSKPILRGHSLAIRQLWHGEEVGRITWWFFHAAPEQ